MNANPHVLTLCKGGRMGGGAELLSQGIIKLCGCGGLCVHKSLRLQQVLVGDVHGAGGRTTISAMLTLMGWLTA